MPHERKGQRTQAPILLTGTDHVHAGMLENPLKFVFQTTMEFSDHVMWISSHFHLALSGAAHATRAERAVHASTNPVDRNRPCACRNA